MIQYELHELAERAQCGFRMTDEDGEMMNRAADRIDELEAKVGRINRLRAALLVLKLTQRIATCHSGNCKRPLLRRQIAMQRIARVERLASQ